VPLAILLANVVSLSTSLGALAALVVLALHLRSRGLGLLACAVAFLATDYLLGLVLASGPASPLWHGLASAGRQVDVVFGLKGACHVGVLSCAPPAIAALFGKPLSRGVLAAGGAAAAALLGLMALLIAGVFPREAVTVYAITAVPSFGAYACCLVLLVRLRPTVPAGRLSRRMTDAAIAALCVFIPLLLAADVLGLSGIAPGTVPVDAAAFLVLSVGILVCSLLVLTGPGRRPAAGDVDAFCAAHGLSVREREVLVLLGEGLRYKQIADRLVISLDTVKTHVSRVYRKTGAAGKTDLFYRIRLGGAPSA
jgi:DNA-binding CsgD family transcriptional regulator